MDSLLQRLLSDIRQLRKRQINITVQQITDILDEIVLFLNTARNRSDGLQFLSTICNELASVNTLKLFDHEDIMKHEFFIIIGRTFEMLLTKATYVPMTKQDEQCFYETSYLIANLYLYKNETVTCFYSDNNEELNPDNLTKTDRISYRKIFFTKSFFDKLARIIKEDLAVNDYEPFHVKYKVINRLLQLCNDIDHDLLLDSVVQCLRSGCYQNAYQTIDLRRPVVNPKQLFFIYQCPQFIRLHSYKLQDKIFNSLCQLILGYSTMIFERHLPIALEGEDIECTQDDRGAKTQAISWHIELLNHFALTPGTRVHFITGINQTIVDQMIEILSTESLIASVHKNKQLFHADVGLISYSITLLYNLIFEKKIFFLLKEKNLLDICAELHMAKDKTIQFASRTLSTILNQEDIDEIDSPSKVARAYLFYIENTIDEISQTYHGIKLDGVLTNLEAIVQNDQIKEEIANDDDGIPLIARCAYDPKLDVETIQYPALKIIDAISFANDTAIERIHDNDKLMDHVKSLSESNDISLGPIAKRILWKVEEEKEFVSKQEEKHKKEKENVTVPRVFDENKAIYRYIKGDYVFDLTDHQVPNSFDLMISYCQADKEICHRIYDRLMASKSYRICFDKHHKHFSNPKAMAQAVENSAVVIMCFSGKYRESYACRLEAEHVFKRKRPIIPVKLDGDYDPTGWLKRIIADKECIDFTKSDFIFAYADLIKEIDDVKTTVNKE